MSFVFVVGIQKAQSMLQLVSINCHTARQLWGNFPRRSCRPTHNKDSQRLPVVPDDSDFLLAPIIHRNKLQRAFSFLNPYDNGGLRTYRDR